MIFFVRLKNIAKYFTGSTKKFPDFIGNDTDPNDSVFKERVAFITVSDLTPTLPIFPSKYDVVPCNFDNCKDSCI